MPIARHRSADRLGRRCPGLLPGRGCAHPGGRPADCIDIHAHLHEK